MMVKETIFRTSMNEGKDAGFGLSRLATLYPA